MKYLIIIFFLSFWLSGLSAQEKHFVFIQSDNNQPFYVSLDGKLYSSTASGYIIVPKLTEGNYNFYIGFAKNTFPEQTFQCKINNKDLGFNLKDFGEKGWGLLNLQSLAVTTAESGNTDNISKALSEKDVAKDDAEPVISFNRKKKDTIAAQVVTKNAADALANEPIAKNEKQKDQEVKFNTADAESIENNDLTVDGNVKKVSESKVEDGVHLAYIEGKKGDTINVIIPSDKSVLNTQDNNSPSKTDVSTSDDASSIKPVASESATTTKDSLKFLNVNMDKSKKDVKQGSVGQENNVSVITNSKCKDIATDDDYARLRRKMAQETTDDKMINAARKIYRNKCFTTRQIKSLSTLFLSDEGRYNFFNASYNSVSDVAEYSILQSEFIDPAFIDRFKAILK